MVKTRLSLSPEVQEILKHIDAGENFLLSGGAGSGKTFSLVQVIRQCLAEDPKAKIACMTYTNSAVQEIEKQVISPNLSVSTIHDLLWDSIKSYQKELKSSLIELANNPDVKQIKHPDGIVEVDCFAEHNIRYKEYTVLRQGIISHDELLVLAHQMFKTYPRLSDILKDRYRFIFIDEYQDTSPLVVQILLEFLQQSRRKNVIGFFGDAMQSIYDDGIGGLQRYVSLGVVQEVKKQQNRRNPRLVYELANKLRKDGIQQHAGKDLAAPNMEGGHVKTGSIKFYYSFLKEEVNEVKRILGWDFSDVEETKELNLTHNLIATKAGFPMLMAIYNGDKILEYKKRITDYLKKNSIESDFKDFTFGDVIASLKRDKTGKDREQIEPTKTMQLFINDHLDLYESAKNYPFENFKKIYVEKENLIDDQKRSAGDHHQASSKRDNLIKHLFKIQNHINLYSSKQYNEFLRKTEFQIKSVANRQQIKMVITHLQGMSNNTIGEVITYADKTGICKIDDKLNEFIDTKQYIYNQVKEVQFREFQKLFLYLEGRTPFSTQHKIKGAEFNNVLVILDNGKWSNYNFQYLFENNGKESVRERTLKIFYVCCTRAKENLAVYYYNPTELAIKQAIEWFGQDNVVKV